MRNAHTEASMLLAGFEPAIPALALYKTTFALGSTRYDVNKQLELKSSRLTDVRIIQLRKKIWKEI
jgi:hypothetical protein